MTNFLFKAIAGGVLAVFSAGCHKEPAAPAVAREVLQTVVPDNTQPQPAVSSMSRKQREVFRIQETAWHLGQAIGFLQELEAAGALRLRSGAKADLTALTGTLTLIRQETAEDSLDPDVTHPSRGLARLDRLFTRVLELEKQVDWPPESPLRKQVAAELVAASDVYESAGPQKSPNDGAVSSENG